MKAILKSLTILLIIAIVPLALLSEKSKKSKKTAQTAKETVIATVGNESISFSELERAFKKNINRKDINFYDVAKDSITDFLKLYVNYRLKVQDALDRHFDKDSAVIADLAQNRRILAETHYYEKRLVEPEVERMFSLRNRELQFAYIVISINQWPDTTKAYKKAKATLDLLKSGISFEKVASDSSDDKETGKHGGIVQSFITAGRVQRPIENVLYNLKTGEYWPDIISTKNGYFIMKLLKNEPRYQVKCSYIRFAPKSVSDSIAPKKRADSVYALIKKGLNFSKLAEENSDDPQTAMRGGDMGLWYSRSGGMEKTGTNLLAKFEQELFNLKDGELSKVLDTEDGYFIIRRDSTRNFDVAAEKDDLRKLYKRIYFEPDKRRLLDSLQSAFGLGINYPILKMLVSNFDTTKTTLDSNWTKKITDDLKSRELYKLNGKTTSVGEFVKTLLTKPEFRATPTNFDGMRNTISKINDPIIFDLATRNLEAESKEFADLIREFKDGILLFKVENMEVWEKLKFDSVAARSFYEKTKDKYWTAPSYDFSEVYVLSDSLAKYVYKQAIAGADFAKLAETYTQRSGYREKKGSWGKVTVKDNKIAKMIDEKEIKSEKILEPFPYEKGFSVVKVMNYYPKRPKTFEEAIPDFAPEFQEMTQKQLLDKWINKIRDKFKVNINDDALVKTLNELKNNHSN